MISFILPTRNRPVILAATLDALGELRGANGSIRIMGEVIVVDNASSPPAAGPRRLANGLPVTFVRLDHNAAAAGRNAGALAATGDWLVMLDDDSYPLDAGLVDAIAEAGPEVAAIGADIHLADGSREAGGLPEVIVGCGAAIRRDAFLQAGGYDPAFGFYAEEYDLCAKLLLAGWHVVHDVRFRVRHHKVVDGRDRDRIFHNLVRNNGWVMQRYAPPQARHDEIAHVIERYGRIAVHEGCTRGFAEGVSELLATLDRQPVRPMGGVLFDRFTGLAHARAEFIRHPQVVAGARAAIVAAGKHAELVRRALCELQVDVVEEPADAGLRDLHDLHDLLVIGTLSPGPMLDAAARCEAICPWMPRGIERRVASRSG